MQSSGILYGNVKKTKENMYGNVWNKFDSLFY